MSQIPELLSPAGSLEKLKVSVLYGADAVYVGGLAFGLRAASENLTHEELSIGVDFAHKRGAKVFVVLNAFLHDDDLSCLPEFCRFLQSITVDAVICSDLGVIATVRENCDLPIHLSTQACCLNVASGKLWKRMGVARLILGREVSLAEAQEIKVQTGLEVELFVHGSLCMSYSGNCVISNYTAGRDSNRGGCAHSCRFEYSLKHQFKEESSFGGRSFFMSSKDLQGLTVLGKYIDSSIDSIKIEGRMKGPIYTATVTKVYREALDAWKQGGPWAWEKWQGELESFAHRDYTLASLMAPADSTSLFNQREELRRRTHEVLGTVVFSNAQEAIVSVKNTFMADSEIEILPFKGAPICLSRLKIKSLGGSPLSKALPSTLVRLSVVPGVESWNMVRKRC